MKYIEKIASELKEKSTLVLILCGFIFVASIMLLFTHEKRKLDEEFESLITDSLNIHTLGDANRINQDIEDAGRALKTAETIFRLTESDIPQEFLAQRNAADPVYIVEYISIDELRENTESFFTRMDQREPLLSLLRGETVVGDICYDEDSEAYFLAVFLPLREEEATTGALYTRLGAAELIPEASESAVYQSVYISLITVDGDIVFNTFIEDRRSNLFDDLHEYGLTQTEIDEIARIIRSPEMDSTIFLRRGEDYFVSAARLQYNGWYLVSFVRGPDVLLRSANIFRDVVRTSTIAILITAAAASIVLLHLIFSRRKLREEKQRNQDLAQRLRAMFDQHSALKVVIDAETRGIVDANPALCNYFGATRQEMLAQSMHDYNLLAPHVLDEQFRNTLDGEVMFSAAPHRLKNGDIKFLDVYASTIEDGGRKLVYAILFDSTDRERYRNELLQEKELLRTTLHSIGDGVVTTDNRGIITSMNSVAENLTGWDDGTAAGKFFTEVFVLRNEDTGEPVDNPIQKVFETGLVVGLANHTELKNRQGTCIPIADSAAPIKSEDGETLGVVMVFRDVSDEKEHSRQVEFLSYHDPLTGLYNRRYIEKMMDQLDAAENLPVSVIMADVNGLKITNDVFGHKAGDALLKNVADVMRKYCSEDNLIARWGGDEFMILMPETELRAAEILVKRLKDTHIEIEDSRLPFSLSLGCACKNSVKTGIQMAMQQAEENMYQQKLLDGKSFRNAIISTLLATLYEKSNETQEHSKRLERYCHAIGRELQLSSREMDELSLLALLHDIGKVSIHPNILKKPGPLTPAEWDEMKRHSEIGYRIAQATPELAIIADLILSHHEHWNGQGYPQGLKGEAIPLACRILAVVDAFDAMTNDRVYRQAITVGEALEEIEDNAGGQFDPRIARLLIQIIKSEEPMQRQIHRME